MAWQHGIMAMRKTDRTNEEPDPLTQLVEDVTTRGSTVELWHIHDWLPNQQPKNQFGKDRLLTMLKKSKNWKQWRENGSPHLHTFHCDSTSRHTPKKTKPEHRNHLTKHHNDSNQANRISQKHVINISKTCTRTNASVYT